MSLDLVDASGASEELAYQVPDQNQCASCHNTDNLARTLQPIGPKARLLNRPLDYGAGPVNQLAHWTTIGVLAGAPDPATAPRLPVWNDPNDGTLEQRAKAYLESNCAHCHRPGGAARQSGLYLEASRDHATWLNFASCARCGIAIHRAPCSCARLPSGNRRERIGASYPSTCARRLWRRQTICAPWSTSSSG